MSVIQKYGSLDKEQRAYCAVAGTSGGQATRHTVGRAWPEAHMSWVQCFRGIRRLPSAESSPFGGAGPDVAGPVALPMKG